MRTGKDEKALGCDVLTGDCRSGYEIHISFLYMGLNPEGVVE